MSPPPPPGTRAQLRTSLVARYRLLWARLSRRLGSQDLAGEALNETWLRLQDGPDLKPVADPDSYLYRAALNAASDLQRSGQRLFGAVEIGQVPDLADENPDPERVAIGRSELARLRKALAELTPRQRDIFIESLGGGRDHQRLAERYKISVRMIQMELRVAILHCAVRLGRPNRFADGAVRLSRE
jgi:RNA polymerase sigma factor (sigma-70 family)